MNPITPREAALDATAASALVPPGHCIVVWRDASFKLNKAPRLAIVCTPGWVVKQDAEVVVVASEDIDGGDARRAFTAIPAGDVLAILPTVINAAA